MTDARSLFQVKPPLSAAAGRPAPATGGRDRTTELLERLAARDARLSTLTAALERAKAERDRLAEERDAYVEDVALLTNRAHQGETELEALRAELMTVRLDRDALHASRSWKLSAPVRWVGRGLQRLRR